MDRREEARKIYTTLPPDVREGVCALLKEKLDLDEPTPERVEEAVIELLATDERATFIQFVKDFREKHGRYS